MCAKACRRPPEADGHLQANSFLLCKTSGRFRDIIITFDIASIICYSLNVNSLITKLYDRG